MTAQDLARHIEQTLLGDQARQTVPFYQEQTSSRYFYLQDCIHGGQIACGQNLLCAKNAPEASAALSQPAGASCTILALEKFIDDNRLKLGSKCDFLLVPTIGCDYVVFAELSHSQAKYRDKKNARGQLKNTIEQLWKSGNPFLGSYVEKRAVFFWRLAQPGSPDKAEQSMLAFSVFPAPSITHEEELCFHFRYTRYTFPELFVLP